MNILQKEKQANYYLKDLEEKNNLNLKELKTLKAKCADQNNEINNLCRVEEKLKEENAKIKKLNENLNLELDTLKFQSSTLRKNNELLVIENSKLKYDIDSYKSEVFSNKDKYNKQRSEIFQAKNTHEKINTELGKVKTENENLIKIKETLSRKITSLEKKQSYMLAKGNNSSSKKEALSGHKGQHSQNYQNNQISGQTQVNSANPDENMIKILELERQIDEKTVDMHVLEMKLNDYNKLKNEVIIIILL